jgi:hypothetical protein
MLTTVLISQNARNEKYVQLGISCLWQWSSQIHKRHVIHNNSTQHGPLFWETWHSHTGVDEDYALLTGEGLWMSGWNIVPSSWTVGPEVEGTLTSRQGKTSQMTWIFTSTAVRISQSPTVVPKHRQEITNLRCLKSQKSVTKHLWTYIHFNVRNKLHFMNVLVQLLYSLRQGFLTFVPWTPLQIWWNLLTPSQKNVFKYVK